MKACSRTFDHQRSIARMPPRSEPEWRPEMRCAFSLFTGHSSLITSSPSVILPKGQHLTYCTNIHRGEKWVETAAALETHTLAVRQRVCPRGPFGIGLRLSDRASQELIEPQALLQFRRWLDQHECYVFTINGFPFGRFHGARVKEQVYLPDWTSEERVAYTNRLFDILAALLPRETEGSVSVLPGAFKANIRDQGQIRVIDANIFRCVEHAARVSAQTDRQLRLALEPEPLCLLENIGDTVQFFDRFRTERPHDPRVEEHLGLNYDACHMAVEVEEPSRAMKVLQQNAIKIHKLHLSAAVKLFATPRARAALADFTEDTYLHQVIVRAQSGRLIRYGDLPDALATGPCDPDEPDEWRVHFHVPLHCPACDWFEPTTDHLLAILDALGFNPALCRHLEMETYTWEVLPAALKSDNVADQLAAEYEWTLERLRARGLA